LPTPETLIFYFSFFKHMTGSTVNHPLEDEDSNLMFSSLQKGVEMGNEEVLPEVLTPGTSYSLMSDETLDWISPYTIPPGSRSEKVETHMSLTGGPYGRLSIPDEMHEAWLRVYTSELEKNKHSLFFAERRTPIFRMHFDLDFVQTEVVSPRYLTSMARECRRVFQLFFPSVAEDAPMWRCALLLASPKPCSISPLDEDDDGVRVKSGCHMIWPWLYVDQVQALTLRANVVDALQRTWPTRGARENSYDDVVDRTVLKSNGLRMMGSDKASKCKKCKPLTREKCKPCRGTGVMAENRPYILSMVLDSQGEPDVERLTSWKDDLFKCVRMTSVRSSRKEHSAGFVVPPHAVTDSDVKLARKKAKTNKNGGSMGSVNTPSEAAGLPGSVTIDASSRIFSELETFLKNSHPQWSGIRIQHLYLQHDLGRYTVNVVGPGSSYCQHVERAHGSSTVFFTVERDGVRQRCFSPKLHNGSSCRKYTGPPTPLSQWLLEAMFGTTDGMRSGGCISTTLPSSSPISHDAILAKSAAYTKILTERVEGKRKKERAEETTLHALGIKKPKRTLTASDRGINTPHPVFTDKTCGEVEKMSSWEVHVLFSKLRKQRMADTTRVHAEEVSRHGSLQIASRKKKGRGKGGPKGKAKPKSKPQSTI
jgi:hypothetical protein